MQVTSWSMGESAPATGTGTGVTAEAAEGFLDALTHADISGHGGVSEATLRPLWRGRMGLSKDEQLQVCQCLPQHLNLESQHTESPLFQSGPADATQRCSAPRSNQECIAHSVA